MKYIIFSLLLFTTFFSFAQKSAVSGVINSKDSTQIKVIALRPDSFPMVSVAFEALKDSKPIFGLQKQNLRVYEDDVQCPIVSLAEISENYPINISLVIDHSGSMGIDFMKAASTQDYTIPMDNAKDAVEEFISGFVSNKDSMQIIGFSNQVDIISEFSVDKNYLKMIIDSMEADSTTAFFDALEVATDKLKHRSGINIIVALTDGMDNYSQTSPKQIIKNANRDNIPIYCIGFGNVDKKLLEQVSDKTNGSFFYTDNSGALSQIYEEVHKRIMSIYDLRYSSNNLNSNDTLRKVRIEFNIDSQYLAQNILTLKIPEETINYIKAKQMKSKQKLTGFTVSGAVIASGILLFVFRRRNKNRRKQL